MLFNSLNFVVFFLIVYALYLCLQLFSCHRLQNLLLLAASYVFYGSWDARFLGLLIALTMVDYTCGIAVYKAERKVAKRLFLGIACSMYLGTLCFFKYVNFFIENTSDLLNMAGLGVSIGTLDVILPIGLSFIVFQSMSYTIDIYNGYMRPERNLLNYALFIAFFPQLVAGPIERAIRMLPQFNRPRTIDPQTVLDGIWLILFGFFLKIYVADNLSSAVATVFSSKPQSGLVVLLAMYAFAFQIFGDFAGYSSIAIGLARLMGFRFAQNFGQPYLVGNPRDFWRHWHISLSTWLRDYLYKPLGGSRGSTTATHRNLLITMLLGGLWHGAAWNFLLWGLYHGVLLIVHRGVEPFTQKLRGHRVYRVMAILVMFQLTCLGWLLFRVSSMQQLGQMLNAIAFNFLPRAPIDAEITRIAFMLMVYGSPVLLFQIYEARRQSSFTALSMPSVWRGAVFAALCYATLVLGEFGSKSFIYFQF